MTTAAPPPPRRAPVRRRTFEFVVGACAIVVSIVSLFVAISANRTQGVPNMIALIRQTAQRLAA